MITTDAFENIVYGYWAKRFNCSRDDFIHPGTMIVKDEEISRQDTFYIYHIGEMSLVRAAPALVDQIGLADTGQRNSTSIAFDEIQDLVGPDNQVELSSTLLDCFLNAKDFIPYSAEGDWDVRQLDPESDTRPMMELFNACTEDDLDDADIYVDDPDPVIFGLFDGEKMTAYASHRYWDEVIGDFGVLIHPEYRHRGLGKAVVSVLCNWCISNEVVPMYRVFNDHLYSLRIPRALGFKELVAIETLKLLKPEK